jgi:hypothetical protein
MWRKWQGGIGGTILLDGTKWRVFEECPKCEGTTRIPPTPHYSVRTGNEKSCTDCDDGIVVKSFKTEAEFRAWIKTQCPEPHEGDAG